MELETNFDFINAATYEDICDFSIIPPDGKVFTDDILYQDSIIFCKTDYIEYLFSNLRRSDKNYVVITHHSDYPINDLRFSLKPDNVKKWFAINPTVHDDSLICIPLGLKTHKGIYLEERYMTKWFVKNIESLKSNIKENVIYCNWTSTNPFRNNIISVLEQKNINFKLEGNLTFDEYATNMSKCKYVISPPGNGIDCHRTWESLYMGCIPIVIKHSIYDNWSELPILQVNDYSELTNEMLESFSKMEFKYDKIYMYYWKKLIKNSL
jgi:hypothetical protein